MTDAAELAVKLKSEGERLMAFFEAIPDAQWELPVYTEGTLWTVRNTLAHLMTAERAFRELFEQIRLGGPGIREDFIIDRYNASQQRKTADLPPADLVRRFREARADMVAWVSDLADADLEKQGRHPFLGVTNLRHMIKMIYIHNQLHYRDIRAALNR